MYACVVCGTDLFSSDTKYESGCVSDADDDIVVSMLHSSGADSDRDVGVGGRLFTTWTTSRDSCLKRICVMAGNGLK